MTFCMTHSVIVHPHDTPPVACADPGDFLETARQRAFRFRRTMDLASRRRRWQRQEGLEPIAMSRCVLTPTYCRRGRPSGTRPSTCTRTG